MGCDMWKRRLYYFGNRSIGYGSVRLDGRWGRWSWLREGWSKAQDNLRLIFWNWPVLLLFSLSCKAVLCVSVWVHPFIFVLCFPFITYLEATGIIRYLDDGVKSRRTGALRLWRRGIAGLCVGLYGAEGETLFRSLRPAVPFFLPFFLSDAAFLATGEFLPGLLFPVFMRFSAFARFSTFALFPLISTFALFLLGAAVCALFRQSCYTELCSLPGMVCSGYSSFWAGKESRRLLRGKRMRTFCSLLGWTLVTALSVALLGLLYDTVVLLAEVLFDFSAASFANRLFCVMTAVAFTVCITAFSFRLYEVYRSEEIDRMYQQDVEVLQVYREYQRRVEELLREQWRRADDHRAGALLRNFFFKNY